MGTTRAARRFRFRVSEAEKALLDATMRLTPHRTVTALVRSALGLLAQVRSLEAQGFQPLLLNRRTRREQAVRIASDKQRLESGFIEIRLTPADDACIRALRRESGGTASHAVREALRLYGETARAHARGFELTARSAFGEMLRLPVTGLGGEEPMGEAESGHKRPRAGVALEPLSPGADLLGLLPASLARRIEEVAAVERCSPQILVIDMLRSEVAHRGSKRVREPSITETDPQMRLDEESDARAWSERRAHPPAEGPMPGRSPETTLPARVDEGWALVLARDNDGAPEEQLVRPDAVIPLDPEDYLDERPLPETD